MGNSSLKDRTTIESGYQLESQSSTLFLGDFSLIYNPSTTTRLLRKDLFIDSTNLLEQITASVTPKSHLNVIFAHEAARGKHLEALCRGVRVTLYYRWVGGTLREEIEGRRKKRKLGLGLGFSENEVWFVMNELSRALQQLAQKSLTHCDIRPENIHKNTHDNYYLYDPTYLRPHDFLTRKLQTGHYCNLSRQAIESITYTGGMEFDVAVANDMWATGLTVLEVMTMKDPICYYRGGTVNEAEVMEQLEEIGSKYSKGLVRIVKGMLARQKKRTTIQQLRKMLKPKQSQIIRQSNFFQDTKSFHSNYSSQVGGWAPSKYPIDRLISPPRDCKISLTQFNRNNFVSPKRDSESSNCTTPVIHKKVVNNLVYQSAGSLCRWRERREG